MFRLAEKENLYPSLETFDDVSKSILEKFHQSKEACSLTQALKEIAIAGVNLLTVEPIIAGRYFEEIAGVYVQSLQQSKERFILTPSETEWVYQEFYSGIHTYSLYNFHTMITGITVPDGLIFQLGRRFLQLKGVCEYTAQNHVEYNVRKQIQLRQYQQPEMIARDLGMLEADCINNAPEYGRKLRELLNQIRPDIPPLPICLANPNSWEIIYAIPAEGDGKRKKLPYLPINNKDFGSYVHQLIDRVASEYQGENQLNRNQEDNRLF